MYITRMGDFASAGEDPCVAHAHVTVLQWLGHVGPHTWVSTQSTHLIPPKCAIPIVQYLFRLTHEGEGSIRRADVLVERLRQLRQTGSVADITVHV